MEPPPMGIPAKQFFQSPPNINGNAFYEAQLPFWAAGQMPLQAAMQQSVTMANMQRIQHAPNIRGNFFRGPRDHPRGMFHPRGRGVNFGMPMKPGMYQQGVSV